MCQEKLENLEKSGDFTERAHFYINMYLLLETMLFQIEIPIGTFFKILSGKPGKVREKIPDKFQQP